MVSLKLHKRLAATVLRCGKRRIWLDPNEVSDIALANSRSNIRKLYKDGYILKKPQTVHSHARVQRRVEAKRVGRHMGKGKRKGTQNARLPFKVIFMRRQRILRRLLAKYRDAKKIDKHMYHDLYMKAKGNRYKTKKQMIEQVHNAKAERIEAKKLQDSITFKKERMRKRKEKLSLKDPSSA
eukprot:g1830.t1